MSNLLLLIVLFNKAIPTRMTTSFYCKIPMFTSAQFVHPGALNKESDFDRMREKVNANEESWISG